MPASGICSIQGDKKHLVSVCVSFQHDTLSCWLLGFLFYVEVAPRDVGIVELAFTWRGAAGRKWKV